MQGQFNQYNITTELATKYSHATYLACPSNPRIPKGHTGGDAKPEQQVALTVFASSLFHLPHEREKLLQKAQRIKELQNAHIVPILDMGIEKEQPFVVRKYLPNGSLRSRLKQISPNGLELGEALTIVSQVGETLLYAHEHNIVHGNIKPENILFGANGQILLTDFYFVTRKDAIIRDQTSEEYAFCYLAPEQFAGTCDARSDQYALGCLAYEIITGSVPFAAQSLSSMMGRPNNALPASISEKVPDVPPSLEVAIFKALAQDPDERFFDFSLFLDVIQSILSPPPAFPLAPSTHFRKNGTISHPVEPATAEDVSSPIRKRAARGTVLQTLEQNAAASNMFEAISQLDIFTPESGADADLAQEKFDDSWLSKSLMEEETDIPPQRALARSIHGQDDLAANKLIQLQPSIIDIPRPQRIGLSYRKKVLGLALALSVSVALITYAFWPSGITQLDTNSHSVQEIAHVTVPLIPLQHSGNPASQGPVQASNNPSVQGALNNPKAQGALNNSAVLSSSQTNTQGTASSSASSSPASPQGSTTTINMTIYFSGWTDNSPPGGSIAYPQIHSTAGGTGTYADPITYAASKNALSPGTIIYVSFLKKYFIMEDDCSTCDSAWNNNHTYEVSLWIGGDNNSSKSAQQSCESSLTPSSPRPVDVQPPSGDTVDTTPLFTDSDGCIKL